MARTEGDGPSPRSRLLTSRSNPRLKWLARLAREGPREAGEPLAAEGPRVVAAALEAGVPVREVFVPATPVGEELASLVRRAEAGGARVWAVAPPLFRAVAGTVTPQGILALVEYRLASLAELLARVEAGARGKEQPGARAGGDPAPEEGPVPLVLVLDGVQDPGNVGTAIRAAAGFGLAGVAVVRGSARPVQPKVVRATAGALFRVPVAWPSREELVAALAARGIPLAVADPAGGVPPWLVAAGRFGALAVGNEGAGVDAALREAACCRLTLPTCNGVESLNAAVAAALLLYEVVRQRRAGSAPAAPPAGERLEAAEKPVL